MPFPATTDNLPVATGVSVLAAAPVGAGSASTADKAAIGRTFNSLVIC